MKKSNARGKKRRVPSVSAKVAGMAPASLSVHMQLQGGGGRGGRNGNDATQGAADNNGSPGGRLSTGMRRAQQEWSGQVGGLKPRTELWQ